MFGSKKNRRRAASNPPLNGSNANANATTAAAQAFLKNRSSNASLASAAAGAALRSRPVTPTSVADVQTKRTIKRANSNSSMGSSVAGSVRGPPGAQLQRRGSSGSMTERTFRDPSPARSQHVPSAPDAPPVPIIPKNMQQSQPPIPAKSHRRAASLETSGMRIASPPPMASGRGSSLGPGATASPKKTGNRNPGLSSVSELTGVPASRGSVNFSLPTGLRPESPMGQRRLTSPSPQRANMTRIVSPNNQNLVYDPNTRSFLPEAQVLAIEQKLYDAANAPVKKKKRTPQAAGTHLAQGGMGGKPRGTMIDDMEAAASQPVQQAIPSAQQSVQQPAPQPSRQPEPVYEPVEPPAVAPPKRKKKKKVVVSDSDSDQASFIPNSSDNDSDFTPPTFNTRAGAMLAKKPSIVREDKEREEEEDDTPKRLKVQDGLTKLDTSPAIRTVSPSPLPRSAAGRGHGRGQASASAAFAKGRQHGRSASQPAPSPTEASPTNGVGLVTRDSVRGGRVQSVSPARTTHFANAPDNLVVKHQPPPRSISPRKSALKHSNSPRGPSPSGVDGSETSNASTVITDHLATPVAKKKANRVSFDETNVVVGQAATPIPTDSPIVQSPQNQTKRWFNIGRGKKKDTSYTDDDDEVMKPRPALPSFGSVREKKSPAREVEERPLVKPAEPIESKSPLTSPLFTTTTGEIIENPLGQSNDHVVGAVFAQDSASKNAANISKSREPLPPQVTSVEGSGYHSDSDSSIYSLENQKTDIGVARTNSVKRGPADGDAETYRALASPTVEDAPVERANGEVIDEDDIPTPKAEDVPEIAFTQATPTLEETDSKREWPDMPGSWGSSTDDSGSQSQDETITQTVEHHATDPTPADIGIAEPAPVLHRDGSPEIGDIAAHAHTHPAILEEPEESDASIYSDAAEDLSDIEGDGFMSLDAVVDSPIINTSIPGLAITTPPESPTAKVAKEKAYRKSKESSEEPEADEGWDKVQAYWSTLSAEQKKRLEREAREEAESSDTEVEIKPAPKPKKKKKVAVQEGPVEKIAPQPTTNGRSYMIQPGTKAGPNGTTMRSSMRVEQPTPAADVPQIRKTMRGSGTGSMRGSMRGAETAEPRGSLQKKHRPMSYPPAEIKPDLDAVKKHIRNLSAASAAAAPASAQKDKAPPVPTLRRRGSGDSDSSFKRARPSNEGTSFRRSMRGPVEQPARQQSPRGSSRFSLRSLSPTGSAFRRPFNTGTSQSTSTPTHMRNSMRGSQDSTPSLRNNNSARTGAFGRAAKPSKQKPSRASRFADSSDEDDDRPAATFRSRFVDSSDEDEPAPKPSGMRNSMRNSAPVRPIPKTVGVEDGDSSDLPDSDDEKSPGLNVVKRTQNGSASTAGQGTTLASGSLRRSGSGRGTISSPTTAQPTRPNHSRRGSFMSILRRKKNDPSSKVRKSDAESPARRDTPLERSKSDLAQLRSDRPSTPRLQKRNPMSRENSASWPLPVPSSPPKIFGGEDGRPFSADAGDGVIGKEALVNGNGNSKLDEVNGDRPDLGTRRFTATGLTGVDLEGLKDGRGKKKKFGKLRKMFRLDD